MKLEHFLANRLAFSENSSFSKVIIRIAILAVGISVAVMIITLASITGFKNQITQKIFGFWGHIRITNTNVTSTFEITPTLKEPLFIDSIGNISTVTYQPITYDKSTKSDKPLTSIGGVRHIQTFAITPGIISSKDDFEGIILKGVDADFDWAHMGQYVIEGKPVQIDKDSLSRDILISRETARRLSLNVGQNIIISFVKNRDQLKRKFKVSGIYNTGLEEYDRRFALVDIRNVQQVLGWDQNEIFGYEIFLDHIEDLDLLNSYINFEVIPHTMYSETIKQTFPSIFEWLELQNINMEVIILLMIIVSVINMITALLILILERTNMIGILKALGSSDWSIRKIFIYQAFYIIGWGLLIGNVLGIGFCLLQQRFGFVKLDETNYYLSVAPIQLELTHILIINIMTLIVILVCLIVPSYMVTKISPLKAIRFQ